ncbi:MAG: hypothetical protein DI535_04520 [Citrobacter freundii]|nr:MAG: hypothetical protein DI535_04520 [Citrobacter freundii]
MIEVFKTNVSDLVFADILVDQIQRQYMGYKANFDLDDTDKILRIQCAVGNVHADPVIVLLKRFGFTAEVLPD